MKISLKDGKPATKEALQALEMTIGLTLSSAFKVFVSTQDGAVAESNMFKLEDTTSLDIHRFIPVTEITHVRSYTENIPSSAYPFAEDSCGNRIIIDEAKDGEVSFWDHELGHITTRLAPDFQTFLDSLEPFDISEVKLKPGQVKRVWVDPEFAKRFKK